MSLWSNNRVHPHAKFHRIGDDTETGQVILVKLEAGKADTPTAR